MYRNTLRYLIIESKPRLKPEISGFWASMRRLYDFSAEEWALPISRPGESRPGGPAASRERHRSAFASET
jgi:hypothetical protein